jgi:hypothetical protein
MGKYIRPETLFGAKFESYLNQPVKNDVGKKDVLPANHIGKVDWSDLDDI